MSSKAVLDVKVLISRQESTSYLLVLDKSELQASNEITFTITASVKLLISKKLILVLKLCLETFDENSVVLT